MARQQPSATARRRSKTPMISQRSKQVPKHGFLSSEKKNGNTVIRGMLWSAIVFGLGLSSFVVSLLTQLPVTLVIALILLVSIMMPLQLLIVCNSAFVYLYWPSVLEFTLFTTSLGLALALSLMLNARFAPLWFVRLLVLLTTTVDDMLHLVLDFVPESIQFAVGCVYTLVSEILLGPAISCLLLGVAQLRYAGDDFNRRHIKLNHAENKDIVFVFIHGNAFNECQWLFGRLHLLSRPWSRKVDFISINIFAGMMMRKHTKETSTIASCAKLAMDQIDEQLRSHILKPKHVVLIGHSLGGVISAYIKEHFAEERKLPVERVIAWSAPFGGSALLWWAKQNLTPNHLMTRGITPEFCPSNPVTRDLLKRMERTEQRGDMYFAVTGLCDPLVRPSSACPHFVKEENRKVYPYLGHYNIKVSINAWSQVVQFADDYMNLLGEL